MSYKPILFNTEMVKAILEGRKTQTRRVMKFSVNDVYDNACIDGRWLETYDPQNPPAHLVDWFVKDIVKKPCEPGDILWVRETWCRDAGRYMYRANYAEDEKFYRDGKEVRLRWSPSIHMPKEAARIFLRVKDVRVERLQDMDEEAAIAEGFADSPAGTDSPLERFSALWDKTVKRDDLREYGYHANPWVWVIEFERIEKPKGWCL